MIILGYFTLLYLIYQIASYFFRLMINQIDSKYQKRGYIRFFLKIAIIILVLVGLIFLFEKSINVNIAVGFFSAIYDTLGDRGFYFLEIFLFLSFLGLIGVFMLSNKYKL